MSIFIKKSNLSLKKYAICLLKLHEISDALIDKYISYDERQKTKNFRNAKSRIEFFGGRIAAKSALENLNFPDDLKKTSIINLKSGEPFVDGIHHISISHSSGYAIAIASIGFKIAIDLQIVEKQKINAMKRLVLEEKFSNCDFNDISILWAMKESLSKFIGVGFNIPFEKLFVSDFRCENGVYFANYCEYVDCISLALLLSMENHNDYAVSISCLSKEIDDDFLSIFYEFCEFK